MKQAVWARILAVAAALAGAGAVVMVQAPELGEAQPRGFSIDPPAPVVACPGRQAVPVGDVGSQGDLASQPTVRTFHVYAPAAQRAAGDGTVIDATTGVQVERIADGDIAGWSALTCTAPSVDQWLVGGSTSLGVSTRLVLTNPSPAPSEVTVTLYGALGQVEETVVVPVPGGGQEDRLLESFAAEQSSLVVHVEATGPGVAAALQDSRLDGFQPAGTSWVGPSVAANDLVIPGVGLDGAEATVTVRLMAPDGARVDLHLISERGVEEWSTGAGITLEPGVVTDLAVPVSRLGAIEVEADAPVFAAARTVLSREAEEGLEDDTAADATWIPGVVVNDEPLLAVVPSQEARIAVYSPYATTVVATDETGSTLGTASVGARTVQWIDINAAPGTIATITGEVAWAVIMTSEDGLVASAMPSGAHVAALEATVVPQPYPTGRSAPGA